MIQKTSFYLGSSKNHGRKFPENSVLADLDTGEINIYGKGGKLIKKIGGDIQNIELPFTTGLGVGEIRKGGTSFIHDYTGAPSAVGTSWYQNTFLGNDAGNFTNGGAGTQGSMNVGIGSWALNAITTAQQNVMVGNSAGQSITTGNYNIGIGDAPFGTTVIGGNDNVAIGKNTLQNINSSSTNIAIGRNAGFYIDGGAQLTLISEATLIGAYTRVSANGTTKETVVGHSAIGKGSNTSIIGGPDNTDVYLSGQARFDGFKLSAMQTAPASAIATGVAGEVRFEGSHIYVCTATNTWKRAAVTTW